MQLKDFLGDLKLQDCSLMTSLRLLFLGMVFFSWTAARAGTLEIQEVNVIKEGPYWVSEWTEFKLPDNVISFQINAFGSPEAFIQVTDLIDPQGKVYTQSDSGKKLTAYSQPILRNVISPQRTLAVIRGMSSTLVPNNPHLGSPAAGVWKFRTLSHYQPLSKKVSFEIVFKTKSEWRKNKIQVGLWMSQDSYWSRNKKQMDQIFQAAQESLQEADLDLELIFMKDLPQKVVVPMDLPADMAALAGVYNDPEVLNVYLMPEMQYQNKPVNGLACIGGPVRIKHLHACFVSMYADERADEVSIQNKGKILAHEIGHYLGLFHTRDDGYYGLRYVYDPLEDTAEEITGTNMMDPGIHDETPHFSAGQKEMLRLSPALN